MATPNEMTAGTLIAIVALVAGLYLAPSNTYDCLATGKAAICDAGLSSTGGRCYYWKDTEHTSKGYFDCSSKWVKHVNGAVSEPIVSNPPVVVSVATNSNFVPEYNSQGVATGRCFFEGFLSRPGRMVDGICKV